MDIAWGSCERGILKASGRLLRRRDPRTSLGKQGIPGMGNSISKDWGVNRLSC